MGTQGGSGERGGDVLRRLRDQLASTERARATLTVPAMNKGETAYSRHLDIQRALGQIVRWDFEPEKFRLADNTYLNVDFRVILPDGTVEFHDVKGRKGDRFYATEDGWLKLKVAAATHPYIFRVVWPAKGGGWCSERVGGARQEVQLAGAGETS